MGPMVKSLRTTELASLSDDLILEAASTFASAFDDMGKSTKVAVASKVWPPVVAHSAFIASIYPKRLE